MNRRRILFMFACTVIIVSSLLVRQWVSQLRLNRDLIAAIGKGTPSTVARLLREGADPNVRLPSDRPPNWLVLIAQWLHGNHVPSSDTALLKAVRTNNIEMVELLLQAGADVNQANSSGEVPIGAILRCENPNPDVMRVLLTHGANPNVSFINEDGTKTPLLIATVDVFGWSDEKTTCLTLVKRLLDQKANVHALDSAGQSVVIHAIEASQRDVAVLLIEAGADISPAHNAGWNLLCWAASGNISSALQALLNRGIAVNSRDTQGRTALMYAAADGRRQNAVMLLANGAAVNARDNRGWTALMFAAQTNNLAVTQLLLQHGANPQFRDEEDHMTAEQRASKVGQEQEAQLLRTGRLPLGNVPKREGTSFSHDNIFNVRHSRFYLDSHHSIHADMVGDRGSVNTHSYCRAMIVDDHGHRGKPLMMDFIRMPDFQVFSDMDGRRYACFLGHHHLEYTYLVTIHGNEMNVCHKYYGEYGVMVQPLFKGGALFAQFERIIDRDGHLAVSVSRWHSDDRVAKVARFRDGKSQDLGIIILPQQ